MAVSSRVPDGTITPKSGAQGLCFEDTEGMRLARANIMSDIGMANSSTHSVAMSRPYTSVLFLPIVDSL